MITIFNGRRRNLTGIEDEIYAQIYVGMRKYIHLFKQDRDLNSWAVFTIIALHANENGWSWPSTDLIKEETGLSTDDAISRSIKHLRSIRIDGHKILEHYRDLHPVKKQWGKSYYHIFPEAGGDTPQAQYPDLNLVLWNPPPSEPGVGQPVVVEGGDSLSRTTFEAEPDSKNQILSPSANDEFAPLPLSRRAQPPTPSPSPEVETYAPLEEEGKVKRKWSPLGLYLRDFLSSKYKGKGVPREFDKLDNRVVVGLGTADSPNNLFVSDPTYRVWVERQMAYWVERKEIEISPRHIVSAIASPTAFSDARWGYLPYRYSVEHKADKDAKNVADVTKAAEEGVVEPWEQEIFNMLKGKTDADASREA